MRGTSRTVSGLVNGAEYHFLVQSFAGGAWSPFSDADLVAATPADTASPASVGASDAGDGSVKIVWEAVSGADRYAVAEVLRDGSYRPLDNDIDGSVCSYTAKGLSNGLEHRFLVQAHSPALGGDWSALAAPTAAATPSGPVKPEPVVSAVSDGRVGLSWAPVSGAERYAVAVKIGRAYATYTYDCKGTSYEIKHLYGGVDYQFLVQAYIDGMWSSFSESDLVDVAPMGRMKSDLPIDDLAWYEIALAHDSSRVLAVENGNRATGTPVVVDARKGWHSQLFQFVWNGGYFSILNAASNKYLAVSKNGHLQTTGSIISSESLFSVCKNDDGTLSLWTLGVHPFDQGLLIAEETAQITAGDSNYGKFVLERISDFLVETLYTIAPSYGSVGAGVQNSSAASRENVVTQVVSTGFQQKWLAKRVAENTYTFRNVNSGLYLAVINGIACQYVDESKACSRWRPSVAVGYVRLTNVLTGGDLTIPNSTRNLGINLVDSVFDGSAGQLLELSTTNALDPGTYFIASSVDTSKVIGIENDSDSDGANIRVWDNSGAWSQKWKLSLNADGTCSITNVRNHKALDIDDHLVCGSNVKLWGSWSGAADQRWIVTWDGAFRFLSAKDRSYALTLEGAGVANGTNVCVDLVPSNQQDWYLFKTSYNPYSPLIQSMVDRAQGFSSSTGWLVLVSRSDCHVAVFSGGRGNWNLYDDFACVVGAPSSPTITGTYATQSRRPSLDTDSRARYCTQINGGYFFHTILSSNSELGHWASHGCVRLPVEKARWIYYNLPLRTTVNIY